MYLPCQGRSGTSHKLCTYKLRAYYVLTLPGSVGNVSQTMYLQTKGLLCTYLARVGRERLRLIRECELQVAIPRGRERLIVEVDLVVARRLCLQRGPPRVVAVDKAATWRLELIGEDEHMRRIVKVTHRSADGSCRVRVDPPAEKARPHSTAGMSP